MNEGDGFFRPITLQITANTVQEYRLLLGFLWLDVFHDVRDNVQTDRLLDLSKDYNSVELIEELDLTVKTDCAIQYIQEAK